MIKSHFNKQLSSKWSIFFLLFLNIVPSFFLSRLAFDNAPETYLPVDQPTVLFEKALRKTFPEDQVAVILFSGDNLYSNDFLEKLKNATQKIKQSEMVERVINVTEMEHISGTEDGFNVSILLGKEELKNHPEPVERFQYAKADQFAKNLVVSEEMEYMAIIVRPHILTSTIERIALLKQINLELEENQIKKFVIAQAGPVVLEVEHFHSMIRDTMMFVPGTMILGMLLIWIMFRRILAVVTNALVSGAVVNCTILLFIVFDVPYTLISAMIPPLLSALTTAFLVHLFNALQFASSYGLLGEARVKHALEHIKKPLIFTALTTAIGLSSLSVSPIPPINHFGLIAATGTIFLLLIVILMLPGIYVIFDNAPWDKGKLLGRSIHWWLRKGLHFSIRHAGVVVVLAILLVIAGIPFMAKVTAETNMLKFYPESHVITQNTKLIEEKISGIMPIEVSFYGKQRDDFKKLHNLHVLKNFENWLKTLPEVDKSNSIVKFIEEMHYAFQQDESSKNQLPNNKDLVTQYLFVYDGNEIYEMVNREFNHARVILSLNEHNSSKLREFVRKLKSYLEVNSGGLTWKIGGDARLFSEQDELLVKGQVHSLIIASFGMFFIMLYLWQKTSYAFITMLPNLSPIIGIFILMGVFDIWLDMATAMIASVAIGIAVDDTIHIFHGFKKRIDNGNSIVFSLVQTYFKAGRAIVVTTIILCSQFMLLSVSQFLPTAHFGLLTATGLLMALLFDLLLLPALIVLFYKK